MREMKKKRSISLFKCNIPNNPYHKPLYKDPSFTNRFEGVVLQKDVYTQNLYKRHFGADSLITRPRKLLKINCSRNRLKEVIISPYCLKTKTDNNVFNSAIEQAKLREYCNPYKSKYGELNFGFHSSLSQPFLNTASIGVLDKHLPLVNRFDNYPMALHMSINKIDERYKRLLCKADPLPNVSANSKESHFKRIKNKYIKGILK